FNLRLAFSGAFLSQLALGSLALSGCSNCQRNSLVSLPSICLRLNPSKYFMSLIHFVVRKPLSLSSRNGAIPRPEFFVNLLACRWKSLTFVLEAAIHSPPSYLTFTRVPIG